MRFHVDTGEAPNLHMLTPPAKGKPGELCVSALNDIAPMAILIWITMHGFMSIAFATVAEATALRHSRDPGDRFGKCVSRRDRRYRDNCLPICQSMPPLRMVAVID